MQRILVFVFCLMISSAGVAMGLRPTFPTTQATLQYANNTKQHALTLELANAPAQQQHGLMFVEHLPDNKGMLFSHQYPHEVFMWMKNTLISLDMIFFDADGKIIDIIHETTPHSLEVLSIGKPSHAVLEVRGGLSRHLGLQPGDALVLAKE